MELFCALFVAVYPSPQPARWVPLCFPKENMKFDFYVRKKSFASDETKIPVMTRTYLSVWPSFDCFWQLMQVLLSFVHLSIHAHSLNLASKLNQATNSTNAGLWNAFKQFNFLRRNFRQYDFNPYKSLNRLSVLFLTRTDLCDFCTYLYASILIHASSYMMGDPTSPCGMSVVCCVKKSPIAFGSLGPATAGERDQGFGWNVSHQPKIHLNTTEDLNRLWEECADINYFAAGKEQISQKEATQQHAHVFSTWACCCVGEFVMRSEPCDFCWFLRFDDWAGSIGWGSDWVLDGWLA